MAGFPGTPANFSDTAAKARVWAPIQSASAWVPARLGIGEVGVAHYGYKNRRRSHLAGKPPEVTGTV